jgi:hypothetical protein
VAPTLAAAVMFVSSGAVNSSAVVTGSFTPANGEIVVIKVATSDSTISMGTPTGGSQTYTSRVASTSGGFRPWVGIYTTVISGSPGSMTISSTPTGVCRHAMLVERWTSAQLAATPVTNSAQGGTGAASSTLTTSAANSVLSWVSADAQSLDPAARAYLGSATDEGVDDAHGSADGVIYFGSQSVASAGSTSYGPTDADSGATAGHTASAEGTDGDFIERGWNSSIGFDWAPTPEEYIVVPGGTANGFGLKSNVAPPAGNYSFAITFHEIG